MNKRFGISIALIVLNLIVFWGLWDHPFTRFDDDIYVYDNPFVAQGFSWEAMKQALVGMEIGQWHPITWMSHILDSRVYGMSPGGHHTSSLQIHIVNCLLLFWLLYLLTGATWPGAVAAALFAIHPLHVEPVVWVASRKDVLSTLFWLLTVLAYWHYVRKPGLKRYLLVALLMIAGLCTKPMIMTLPATLLILDFWPLERIDWARLLSERENRARLGWLVLEKVPLLLICLGFLVIYFRAVRAGNILTSLDALPLSTRLAYVPINYAAYLVQTLYPAGMIPIYPHPGPAISWLQCSGAILLVGVITWLAVRSIGSRPYLAAGWAWFLVTLFPVIGIVHFAAHVRADRYAYVPHVGLFVMLVWGMSALLGRLRLRLWRGAVAAAACAVFVVWTGIARNQVGYWRSDLLLTGHILRVCPNHASAENNRGLALVAERRLEEALPHFERSVRIQPTNVAAIVNYGATLKSLGRYAQAIKVYSEGLRLSPKEAALHANLGNCLVAVRAYQQACDHFRTALALNPRMFIVYYNLGRLYEIQGKWEEARESYTRLAERAPEWAALGKEGISRVAAAQLAQAQQKR
ncbi:MAG: tetratricopeptide repeat protein [Acidobacteriota bacterium]